MKTTRIQCRLAKKWW